MNSTQPLNGSHLRTYQTIFQHPVSHNLEWHDVYALFRQLGHVEEEHNGNMKVARNGQVLVLRPSRTKDVADTEELMALRHFLERSEPVPPEAGAETAHWLLVIDHHEARLFRSEMRGALPQQILPHEPDDYFRHAHHSRDFSRGQEKPDPNSFFEPVARALHGAGRILIFGAGTGSSSEMNQFIGWLTRQHPDLARQVIGTVVVDEHHLTEDQLLAKARDFYASTQMPSA
ncbi:MAG: hypothetical protein ABSH26_15005 [Opitutaceae bacterium]|jgi:hypothetical protein